MSLRKVTLPPQETEAGAAEVYEVQIIKVFLLVLSFISTFPGGISLYS
ncbi:MAG: hypothetical protein ACK52J_01465 [bacterium]